jgi:hypothetical protein
MAKTKTLGKLKKETQEVCNMYIRLRDKDRPCISCNQFKPLQAGHFFAVSTHDGLTYDADNIWGECAHCNCWNESHLINYRDNLLERIGQERFDALYSRAEQYKKQGYRFTRSELIEIKKKYQQLIKEL